MNILAYVHLRGIVQPTGAGRVARSMVEELHRFSESSVKILANASDCRSVIPKLGSPWNAYDYRLFDRDTSRQQAHWIVFDRPTAETYWPAADLVYCPTESYVPTRRTRLAVTAHDAACFERGAHRASRSAIIQAVKRRYLFRMLTRKADRILTVSHFSAERLGYFFPGLKSRLRVIPNGVPGRFFEPVSPAGEAALANLGLLGRQFVLAPGGLQYRKNADLILRAWPLLQQMHSELLLVVTNQYEADYFERAQGLGPSVRLIGFIDDELLCSLYSAASAVWFPSLYEGFGMPVLEAMASGTPVVGSTSSALPEVAGNAAILVSPRSLRDNVDAIDGVLRTPSLVDSYVAAGRRRAREFTWTAIASKLFYELKAMS